jgi:hypothetical protein
MISRKLKEFERDEDGRMHMTKNNIKIICEKEGLYEFPELNDKLYLHYKGTFFFLIYLYQI